jgi:N-methylhydantoinase B
MTTDTATSPVLSGAEHDPVTFEVVRSSMVNLVSEMGVRLSQVAFSAPISVARDFSLAMCAPNGDMICTGPLDQPAHVGTLEFTTRCVLEKYSSEEIRPGDFFLLNEPHEGGTHNNDMRVVYPVFVDGELFVWLIACGHWSDVGGPVPGSFNAMATSCFAEGVRVPPVRLGRDGEMLDDVVEVILGNVRLYHISKGDLLAEVEACRAGERRLHEIVDKHGADTVRWAMDEMIAYSERLLAASLEDLPNGTYEWTDWIDVDLPAPDPQPYKVHLKLTIEDGRLTFDYRGSDPQPVGPSGSSLPMTWSATICGVLNMFPGVLMNHGVTRNIEVLTTPGTCVDVQFPGAICGTAAGVYEKVLASVVNCFGQADPERKAGATYNLANITVGGNNERGEPWVMYLWPCGGFGATARGDSRLPSMMLFSAGTQNQPTEVLERAYPVHFERVAMKRDSGGAGRYLGGPGSDLSFFITEGRSEMGSIGDRNRFPIWGVDGGEPGGNQDVVVSPDEPGSKNLTMNFSGERLEARQRVHVWTGGGGGYGDPLERPPAEVLEDVIDDYVSIEGAAERFGVVIEAVDPDVFDYRVDEQATAARRAELRGA